MVPEQTARVCPVSTRRAPLSAAVPSTEGERWGRRGAGEHRQPGDEFKFVVPQSELFFDGEVLLLNSLIARTNVRCKRYNYFVIILPTFAMMLNILTYSNLFKIRKEKVEYFCKAVFANSRNCIFNFNY